MPYTQMALGGYEFSYNPVKAQSPKVKVVAETATLTGRVLTDWGTAPSRQDITLNWPVMDCCMFAEIETKALLPGTLSFTDDDGSAYTVLALPPTYDAKTPRADAFLNVTLVLKVVSLAA